MGTSSLKSSSITNRDALPRIANNSRISGGHIRVARGAVTAVAADDSASRYRVVSLPSNCMVIGVLLSTVAQGGSAAADIGIYQPTERGGALVDVDLFASAQTFVSALSRSDVTNESTTYTPVEREKPLWQAAGLTADPGGELDVVIGPTAAFTNGGIVGLEVHYVV